MENEEKGKIDLDKILLPKKEGPSPDSAQRINAGALLEQETNENLTSAQPAQPQPVAPPPPPKKEEPSIQALETYRGDIEKLVQQKNVSVVSIAAAEAQRRGITEGETTGGAPQSSPFPLRTVTMIGGGVVLVVGALSLLAFIFFRPAPSVPVAQTPAAPFILVDDTQAISFTPEQFSHGTVMNTLIEKQTQSSLSLGLISRFYLAISSTTQSGSTAYNILDAQQLLSILAPTIPQDLLRAIAPSPYLLGFHAFDGNQAFLILKVDSYEQAFSGMLAWESTMQRDLSPLFTRTPRPHIPEEGVATSTATSTTPQLLSTGFVDRIVENHDARVMQNESGDLLLLWTFLDRSTLVVTTNEYTLREIISRLTNAPVTPQP